MKNNANRKSVVVISSCGFRICTPVKYIIMYDNTKTPGMSNMIGPHQIFDLTRLKSNDLCSSALTPADLFSLYTRISAAVAGAATISAEMGMLGNK